MPAGSIKPAAAAIPPLTTSRRLVCPSSVFLIIPFSSPLGHCGRRAVKAEPWQVSAPGVGRCQARPLYCAEFRPADRPATGEVGAVGATLTRIIRDGARI